MHPACTWRSFQKHRMSSCQNGTATYSFSVAVSAVTEPQKGGNMGKKITEKEIKRILRNKDTEINSIHNKLYTVKKDLFQQREIIETICLSSPISGIAGPKGTHKDLSDVYEKYQETLGRRRMDYKSIFRYLERKEEDINRVWQAYLCLEDPYYRILTELYVNNRLYADVEQSSGMSHRIFEQNRKQGIQQIKDLYQSDSNISILLLMKEKKEAEAAEEKKQTKKKESKQSEWEQMSLDGFLNK